MALEKRDKLSNAHDKFMLPASFEFGRDNHFSCVCSTVKKTSICDSQLGLRELGQAIILRENLIFLRLKFPGVLVPGYNDMCRITEPNYHSQNVRYSCRRQSWREAGQHSDMPSEVGRQAYHLKVSTESH